MRRATRMMLLDRDRERERRRERYPDYIPQGYSPEYEGPYMGWDAYITSRPERENRPTMTYLDESRHWPMEMRPIGFGRDWPTMGGADASVPRYREMDRMAGNRAVSGHSESTYVRPLDAATAEEWAADMDNEDGTHGPHWSMDQVRQLMAQRGITCPLPDFFAAINAVYSDYVKVAKKHGVGVNMDYYVDMALAWLDDKDAVQDKAAAYYRYIVKH